MRTMAKVTLVGYIGSDAHVRFTNTGKQVTTFSLATQHRQDGPATWWRVETWEKLAEITHALQKGEAVLVTGDAKLESYENRDGSKGQALVVTAQTVLFLSPKKVVAEPGTAGGDDIPF